MKIINATSKMIVIQHSKSRSNKEVNDFTRVMLQPFRWIAIDGAIEKLVIETIYSESE